MDFDEILDAVRSGRMVVVVDGRDGSGEICLAATRGTRSDQFHGDARARAWCASPSPKRSSARSAFPWWPAKAARGARSACRSRRSRGVSTGISAADRATRSSRPSPRTPPPSDLVMPGHVLPVQVRRGGVLSRPQIPEASVDLARLAGMPPMAVTCAILRDDGAISHDADLEAFADRHNLPQVTIESLVRYRLRFETLVTRVACSPIRTRCGRIPKRSPIAARSTRMNTSRWCAARSPEANLWWFASIPSV